MSLHEGGAATAQHEGKKAFGTHAIISAVRESNTICSYPIDHDKCMTPSLWHMDFRVQYLHADRNSFLWDNTDNKVYKHAVVGLQRSTKVNELLALDQTNNIFQLCILFKLCNYCVKKQFQGWTLPSLARTFLSEEFCLVPTNKKGLVWVVQSLS